ncbi:MAG: NAD(P)-binding domain-containing protein, partial [Verrucomicrobiota bacterium]
MKTAAVVGAGSFGTALASALVARGLEVTLWGRNPEVIQEIQDTHSSLTYLPGVHLPEGIHATVDLEECRHAELVLLAIPSQ